MSKWNKWFYISHTNDYYSYINKQRTSNYYTSTLITK